MTKATDQFAKRSAGTRIMRNNDGLCAFVSRQYHLGALEC